ncbi:hypothetical protein C9374_009281 [Naegleria lovaniensis]|uniref:Uncharacterized protein n=1 Tax=Naegleria lovaniensis TaxID=51637 RepID=A0AA88GHS6_NAELO|nr:uncharacterized protein C9374_009281 [Naegleria lovaniensis]KAG2377370.1 hypothetical protein C9374_009281 [Naegleria lovaniensis]
MMPLLESGAVPSAQNESMTFTNTPSTIYQAHSSSNRYSASPFSSGSSGVPLQALLDEKEQEELISKFHSQACTQYKLYSYTIGTACAIFCVLFLYFAYVAEDFGESIGMQRVRLIHTLCSVGLLCLSVRCFYRYTLWKRSKNLSSDNNNSNLRRKREESILLDVSYSNEDDEISSSLNIVAPSESWTLLQAHEFIAFKQRILFICLFVAVLFAAIELLLWAPHLQEQFTSLYSGVDVRGDGFHSFKLAILIFPFVLPLMLVASEYGHYLLNQNFIEIIDLSEHRYKFKSL